MSVKIDIGDLTDHTVEITFRDATGIRRRILLDPERACGRVDLRRSERAADGWRPNGVEPVRDVTVTVE